VVAARTELSETLGWLLRVPPLTSASVLAKESIRGGGVGSAETLACQLFAALDQRVLGRALGVGEASIRLESSPIRCRD
jgi:hypothetical protein